MQACPRDKPSPDDPTVLRLDLQVTKANHRAPSVTAKSYRNVRPSLLPHQYAAPTEFAYNVQRFGVNTKLQLFLPIKSLRLQN